MVGVFGHRWLSQKKWLRSHSLVTVLGAVESIDACTSVAVHRAGARGGCTSMRNTLTVHACSTWRCMDKLGTKSRHAYLLDNEYWRERKKYLNEMLAWLFAWHTTPGAW